MGIFTEEEFNEVKVTMSSISHTIPEHLMGKIWSWFQKIGNHQNPQPCACQSSAKYWIEAVNGVNSYIQKETNEEKGKVE